MRITETVQSLKLYFRNDQLRSKPRKVRVAIAPFLARSHAPERH